MIENKSLRVIQRREYQEIHIQLIPLQGETPEIFSEKIAELVQDYNAIIIRATFFGKLNEEENFVSHFFSKLNGLDFPYSWIEGDNCTGSFINGVYIFAISGIEIKRLYKQDRAIGSFFQTSDADFCYLGGLYSKPDLSPSQQTSDILFSTEKILNQVGLSFQNTIRTWFYLDDILDWYNDFNLARTAFFQKHDIYNKLVPASTGIAGRNNFGSKVCLELTAINPKSEVFSIVKVKSPLQCPAENYGSSFSRSVSYSDNEYKTLTVSGTASINSDGKTMHIDNMEKQIELTFKVVNAILESQNFKFSDIIRFYAYCSDKSYSKVFFDYIESSIPFNFAFICSENKICRDGLLFEIELDAVKSLQKEK